MTPEYIERLAKAVQRGHIDQGSVLNAEVFHEDDCKHWIGAGCTCDPDVLVKRDGITYKVDAEGALTKTD